MIRSARKSGKVLRNIIIGFWGPISHRHPGVIREDVQIETLVRLWEPWEKAGVSLAKGFCRAKFWAKFAFWRVVWGEVLGRVFGEAFGEVFGLDLLGQSDFKKRTSAKTSAQKSHVSAQQN